MRLNRAGWSMTDPVSSRERFTSAGLFVATLVCVFFVYGFQWTAGNPLTDPAVARDSALFALGLMAILGAHEAGHYLVALRHGFRLSLPYFLPLPLMFGTLGAFIRLRSPPANRTALLEMGVAGPLAGFAVAMVVMALGLPHTTPQTLDQVLAALPPVLVLPPPPSPVGAEAVLVDLLQTPPLSWIFQLPPEGTIPLSILANPPIMDLLGHLLLGAAPGRYDTLDPLAMAAWVGCLLTGINLLPVGQLDGGHVVNALAPRLAPTISKIGVGVAFVAGIFWGGWLMWAVLLVGLQAWISLPVPESPGLTLRARALAALAVVVFGLSFMPRPFEVDAVPAPVAVAPATENPITDEPPAVDPAGAEADPGAAPVEALSPDGR